MVLQFGKVSQELLARVGQGSEYYCPVCYTSQATRLKTFSYLLQLKEETFVESCSTHHFCCCAISDRCTVARWALCYKFIPKQLCLQFLVLQKRFKLDGFFVVVFFSQVIQDVVRTRTPTPFVVQWISRHIPDIEKWRAFIPDTHYTPNQAAVNELLNQFFSNSAFPARYLS